MRLKRLPMRGRKRTESMMSNVKQMRRNEEQKIKHSMTSYANSLGIAEEARDITIAHIHIRTQTKRQEAQTRTFLTRN